MTMSLGAWTWALMLIFEGSKPGRKAIVVNEVKHLEAFVATAQNRMEIVSSAPVRAVLLILLPLHYHSMPLISVS